ncbi:hypothetical protein N9L76_02300 [bacterium]|nr:hypothetical protein [bacterium]
MPTPSPTPHHALTLPLNACGVECCPHEQHRGLVAVASYLHRPGDEDNPGSRVGQLYLYDLEPIANVDGDGDVEGDASTGWSFQPAGPPLDTKAIFELAWAPRSWSDDTGPALAQADAGGFLTLYRVRREEGVVDGGVGDDGELSSSRRYTPVPLTTLQCGGGGLGMTTCVAWASEQSSGDGIGNGDDLKSSRLAVVGADGGLRVVSVLDGGELCVEMENSEAHSLEAWAVAFANASSCGGPDVLFTGADDACFKAWDVRCGLASPVMQFNERKSHGAGVTCVSPSPHDLHVVATGSYDESVRLWDVRVGKKPKGVAQTKLGGGSWRLRWHPRERRLAIAAMDGGAVVLDWDGCEIRAGVDGEGDGSDGVHTSNGAGYGVNNGGKGGVDTSSEQAELVSKSFNVSCEYDGHGSIAYGADWGYRSKQSQTDSDVIVSCSFYDKGLHVWTPPKGV